MSSPRGTDVKTSALGGRGLFATKSHDAGDVVLSLDRPLITGLDAARVPDTCSWCFSWTELPVLAGAGVNQATKVNWCTGCKKVKYCSKACQSKAWTVHKRECKIFGPQPGPIPNTVIAVMQILRGLKAGDAEYKQIQDHMVTHREDFEKAGGKRNEAIQLMAHTALKLNGEKEETNQLESAKNAMCAFMCNSMRLTSPTFDPLGLALDPKTSVINHSCVPNAIVVFDGPRLTVRALDSIQTGDEVLISYIDSKAPFGVRQAELKAQYFFTCNCTKCQLGLTAPEEAFSKPGPEFKERIKVIDEMIPEITKDPAWDRHIIGESTYDQRLSALQYYAYAYLESPDAENEALDPAKFRKAITIIRNSEVFPLTRAPLPALYQQHAVACLGAKRYNEALIIMLRMYTLIDPKVSPQAHHPVRVVHAWTLATLAKAVGNDPTAAFCKALDAHGVDLSLLFVALLNDIHAQVPKSHGTQSIFGRMVEGAWQAMMEAGGELDTQYAQVGLKRDQWQGMLNGQIKDLWSKIQAFVENEEVTAQIDAALVPT